MNVLLDRIGRDLARWSLPGIVCLCLVRPSLAGNPPPERGDFQPQWKPTADVPRATGPVEIDGELSEDAWAHAVKLAHFSEVQPGDQLKPPVESEAWLAYDDENLYVALIAHDDPKSIRVSLRERDEIFNDDYFGVMLDPYCDHTSGYEFFVNPLGIQGDLRMIQGGENEDIGFDAIWHSKGRVTESGYQVEIALPFASLRFSDQPEQTWRVNFWRDHQREVRRRYAWAATDRDDPCFMCNWGTLTGLRGIRPGSALDIIANAISTENGELRTFSKPNDGFDSDAVKAEASLNLRYALSSTSTAEVAINPDFSQIESDATQIDVNTAFALYYDERRPFFQEGSDLYNSWITAVYTRSILNPEAAGKFSARYGRLGLAYTIARDENSPVLVPLSESTEGATVDQSVSQIVRARRTFGDKSFLGGVITDRRIESGGSGTLGSIDGSVQFFKNYLLESQVAVSREVEPKAPDLIEDGAEMHFGKKRHTVALDGESFNGHAIYASLERSARIWSSDFDFWEYSPTFRSDNGFTSQNDYRQTNWWNGLAFQPNGNWVKEWDPRFGFGRIWSYDGTLKQDWIRPHASIDLKYQTNLFLEYWRGRERWDGHLYDGVRTTTVELDSRFSELVGGGGSVVAGR